MVLHAYSDMHCRHVQNHTPSLDALFCKGNKILNVSLLKKLPGELDFCVFQPPSFNKVVLKKSHARVFSCTRTSTFYQVAEYEADRDSLSVKPTQDMYSMCVAMSIHYLM